MSSLERPRTFIKCAAGVARRARVPIPVLDKLKYNAIEACIFQARWQGSTRQGETLVQPRPSDGPLPLGTCPPLQALGHARMPSMRVAATHHSLVGNHSCHNGAHLSKERKAELERVCEHIAQSGKGITACDEGPGTIGEF